MQDEINNVFSLNLVIFICKVNSDEEAIDPDEITLVILSARLQ